MKRDEEGKEADMRPGKDEKAAMKERGEMAMSAQSFSMAPFAPAEAPSPLPYRLCGQVGRQADIIAVRYELSGRLEDIDIPRRAEKPLRKDGLWKGTCFELFLAVQGSPRYWEINASPAGDWNVYRFTGYREGMTEEPALRSLPITVAQEPRFLRLTWELDPRAIVRSDNSLDLGISAVTRHRTGDVRYWAIFHPGPKPDFHRRDGFIMTI